MSTRPQKIFGIGLNKTATRSLAVALRELGFRTFHKGDGATSNLVDQALSEGVPLLTHIGTRYDAYLDVKSIVTHFSELDVQYPGSRFILTVADEAAWLTSREKHVLANQERARRGEYEGDWLEVDVESWRAERESHTNEVVDYFRGRPQDLLVLDIVGGDGWETLAPFLKCRVPRREFPWENRAGKGTYRRGGHGDALRRRLGYAIGRIRRVTGRS